MDSFLRINHTTNTWLQTKNINVLIDSRIRFLFLLNNVFSNTSNIRSNTNSLNMTMMKSMLFTEMYRIFLSVFYFMSNYVYLQPLVFQSCPPWESLEPYYYCFQHPFHMAIPSQRQRKTPFRAKYAETDKQNPISELN